MLCGSRFLIVTISLCASIFVVLAEEKHPPLPEPIAYYISPVGSRQGSTVEVRIDGKALADTYAVWTDCEALQASVQEVVEVDRKITEGEYLPKKELTHEVTVQVNISPLAEVGGHTLRLISPRGISNPMPFRVSFQIEPVISEDESQTGSGKPTQGQFVEYPVAINGKISKQLGGEIDYYGFDVEAGRELYFEAFYPSLIADLPDNAGPLGGEILLYLYELSPSWVDPHRLVQLKFNDDPMVYKGGVFSGYSGARARLKHRFAKSGRYLIAVKAFDDQGGPGFVYQLRIALPKSQDLTAGKNSSWPLAHPLSDRWMERSFDQYVSASHIEKISSRTVLLEPAEQQNTEQVGSGLEGDSDPKKAGESKTSAFDPLKSVKTYHAIQDSQGEVSEIELPAIVEGVIDHSGKIDLFRFRTESGQALAFEIETPLEKIPRFHPWVRILDEKQEMVFSSIYNKVHGNNVQLHRYLEPKMTYTFEQDGEYTLQIRDLTSRYSGSDFSYRVLIRSQIPHVGKLELDAGHVNLLQGEAKRLTVTIDREEGFKGEIAIGVENLPVGVRAYPTAMLEADRPSPFDESLESSQKAIFRPETQKLAIMLIADPNASVTELPYRVSLKARPIVEGMPGELIAVKEFPLMVVSMEKNQTSLDAAQQSQN